MQIERRGTGYGWYWLKEAFALHRACWGEFLGLAVFLVLSGLLALIPFPGFSLQILIATFAVAAQFRLADRAAAGRPCGQGLFDFPDPVRNRLLKVAGFLCVSALGFLLLQLGALVALAGDVREVVGWLADPKNILPPVRLRHLMLLISGSVVLGMLYWCVSWALIPLALWTNLPLRTALGASWVAGWRNWRPLLWLSVLVTGGSAISTALLIAGVIAGTALNAAGGLPALLILALFAFPGIFLVLILISNTLLYSITSSIFPEVQAGQKALDPRPDPTPAAPAPSCSPDA